MYYFLVAERTRSKALPKSHEAHLLERLNYVFESLPVYHRIARVQELTQSDARISTALTSALLEAASFDETPGHVNNCCWTRFRRDMDVKRILRSEHNVLRCTFAEVIIYLHCGDKVHASI